MKRLLERGQGQKKIAGLLCYSLTPATVDLLNRVEGQLSNVELIAFPLVKTDTTGLDINFRYHPASFKGRFWSLRGQVPDSQLLTVQISLIFKLVTESDLIVLLGIQSIPAFLSVTLSRILRKPVLTISQAMPPVMEKQRAFLVRRIKQVTLNLSKQHIAQTEATRHTLTDIYGIRSDQVIYAPFDGGGRYFKQILEQNSNTNTDDIRRELQTPLDATVFLYVGTLVYLKGIDLLVEAFNQLTSEHSGCYLWIVGENRGTNEQMLREQVKDYNLSRNVVFVGRKSMDELVDIYRSADVFVLPTRKDVWPKVLVEAALVGLPLITTVASGAAHSLVEDGRNGYVVPIDDIDSLCKAMNDLLDPALQEKMSRYSISLVDEFIQPELEARIIADTMMDMLWKE